MAQSAASGAGFEYTFINDLSGGINSVDSPVAIADNQYRKAMNFYVSKTGALTKRKGYDFYNTSSINSSTTAIYGLYRFYQGGIDAHTIAIGNYGVNDKVLRQTSSSVYTWITSPTSGAWLSNAGIQINDYRDMMFAYCKDGSKFCYWNGDKTVGFKDVGFISTGVVVQPRLMCISDDRVFVVDARYKDEVFYTTYDGWLGLEPTEMNFETNASVVIPERSNNMSGITALFNFGMNDEMLVCRENDVYALYGVGTADYTLKKVSDVCGCINQKSICATEYGSIVFVGVDNVYEMVVTDADNNSINPIGDAIRDKISNVQTSKCCCAYYPAIESVLVGTTNGTLVYNCRSKAWTEWDIPISNMLYMHYSLDSKTFIFTKYDVGYVWNLFATTTDNTANVSFDWESKIYDGKEFAEYKKFRSVKFLTDTNMIMPFTSTFKVDDGMYEIVENVAIKKAVSLWGSAKFGTGKWAGGTLSILEQNLDDRCTGNFFAIKITGSNANQFTIYSIGAEETVKERRREQ